MMKYIKLAPDGKVMIIIYDPDRLTDKQKEELTPVSEIPRPDRDPSLWQAQLYYNKDKKSLYYKYIELTEEEKAFLQEVL